jgi:hypothetical protein
VVGNAAVKLLLGRRCAVSSRPDDVLAERGFGFASDGMAAMERSADDLPPPYFGDYPHGAYWSASHQDSSVNDDGEAEDFTVEGTRLRVMWDEGAGPLWGDEGLLATLQACFVRRH